MMKSLWFDQDGEKLPLLKERRTPNCPKCGANDISKFYTDDKGRRTNAHCKECHKVNSRNRWHSKTRAEKQATRVHAMYGITPEEYLSMYEMQEGKCKICEEKPQTKRGLHVDHCHKTNRVRGLLCHGCNVGLGSFRDNAEVMAKAIEYIGANT